MLRRAPALTQTGSPSEIVGADGDTLPATEHDVVVWLAGAAYDLVFDVSTGVVVSPGSPSPR